MAVADVYGSVALRGISNDEEAKDKLLNAVHRVNDAGMGFQAQVSPGLSDEDFVHVIGTAKMGNRKALYAGFGKLFELLQEDENAQ